MTKLKPYMKSLDNIKCRLLTSNIQAEVKSALSGFKFSGGDSDYRGFHFDGENERGTEFSIEQMKFSNDITVEEYELDLWVRGDDEQNVNQTFERILQVLKQH